MVLNKKAQLILAKIMVGIIVFIAAITFIQPLNEQIATSTNSTNLTCSNTDLAVEHKATCIIMEMGLFYFISVCIAVGLAVISGKKTMTGILITIFVFVVIIVLITPLKDLVVLARDSDHLNCAASTITVPARMTCIFVDLWLFYFVVICIAAALTYTTITKVIPYFIPEE